MPMETTDGVGGGPAPNANNESSSAAGGSGGNSAKFRQQSVRRRQATAAQIDPDAAEREISLAAIRSNAFRTSAAWRKLYQSLSLSCLLLAPFALVLAFLPTDDTRRPNRHEGGLNATPPSATSPLPISDTNPSPPSSLDRGRLGGPGDPLIPRRIVFTYKYNLLARPRDQIPDEVRPLYDNVLRTVAAYREAWDDPGAEVVFLDDDACVDVINRTEPALLPLFFKKKRGMYKADICRVAELCERGGYYFDCDMEVILPYVASGNVSFVTAWGGIFHEFFQSFLAASPRNPIVRQSMREMLHFYNRTKLKGRWGNLGPVSLVRAYEGAPEEDREKAVLLQETDARKINYENVTLRGESGGCNWVVHDPLNERVHFYSRIVGSTKCKK